MIGTLTQDQIEHVLQGGLIGRIGCHDEHSVYVVPVTYVFQDNFIYAHSREGLKISMMRKNQNVCFEVDSIEGMTNWRCVIIRGTFEELTAETDRTNALRILQDRLMPYLLSETMRPHGLHHAPAVVEKERKPVVYRIRITEMTGRYEKNSYPTALPR